MVEEPPTRQVRVVADTDASLIRAEKARAQKATRDLDAAVHSAEKARERVWQDEQTLNAQWDEMAHEVVRLLKIVQWFQRVSPAFLLMVLAFGAWAGAGLISLALLHYLLLGAAFICGALAFVVFAVGYRAAG